MPFTTIHDTDKRKQRPEVYIPCMSPRNHADCDAVLSRHSRSLLAKFGLTRKSRRGLASSEAGDAHQAARCVVTDWRRINGLRLRCFRFRKCRNRLHVTVGGVYGPYAVSAGRVKQGTDGLVFCPAIGNQPQNASSSGRTIFSGFAGSNRTTTCRSTAADRVSAPARAALTNRLHFAV